jgi:hypothetical protein
MEAQSKTLGGGLSNLQDSFEQLKLAIGEAAESGGFFSMMLDGVAGAVKGLTKAFKGNTIEQSVDALKELKRLRYEAALEGDIELWSKYNSIIRHGTTEVQKYYDTHIKGAEKLAQLQNDKKSSPAGKAIDWERWMKKSEFRDGMFMDLTGQTATKDSGKTGLSSVAVNMEAISNRIKTTTDSIKVTLFSFANTVEADIAPVLNEAFANIAIGIGDALGSMASGVGGLESLTAALLGGIGNMAVQLGQLAIATGFAIAGIKKALMSLNPAVAIAGGVALVALGKMVSNKAASIAKGGSSEGGNSGSGSLGSRPARPVSSRDTRDMVAVMPPGEWKIEGRALKYIIDKENALDSKRKG